jgi:hypothetical protein
VRTKHERLCVQTNHTMVDVPWLDASVEVLEPADDPRKDLTGSIRRTTAVTCIARERDGGPDYHRWIAVELNEAFTDEHMRGSEVIGSVPGTPAAEQQQRADDRHCDNCTCPVHVCGYILGTPDCVDSHPRQYPDVSGGGVPYPSSQREPRVFRSDGPEPPPDVECLEFFRVDDEQVPRYLKRSVDLCLPWVWVSSPNDDVSARIGDARWPIPRLGGEFREVLS